MRYIRRSFAVALAVGGGYWAAVYAATEDGVIGAMALGLVLVALSDALVLLPWDERDPR